MKTIEIHDKSNILKFITCGSVDDGKSTLIGRLLFDCKAVKDDIVLKATVNGRLDFARLVDGLLSEFEQGITIDVAYRYFSHNINRFIIADCPGHQQYTKNMVTGASTSNAAIVLIDARKGVLEQSIRHSYICLLLGIKKFIVAINKMDLINYDENIFMKIKNDFKALALNLNKNIMIDFIPISALCGENIIQKSSKMPWYSGNFLLKNLEDISSDLSMKTNNQDFIMPVSYVCLNNEKRFYKGFVSSGEIKKDNTVYVLPSNERVKITQIITNRINLDDPQPQNVAKAGQSISVCVDGEFDISRGSIFSSSLIEPSNIFEVDLICLSDSQINIGEEYILKTNTTQASAKITKIIHKIDISSLKPIKTNEIRINDIVRCEISSNTPLVLKEYEKSKTLGSLILIHKHTNVTLASAMVRRLKYQEDTYKNENIFCIKTTVSPKMRSAIKNHNAGVIWFSGLSGSGKSTLANVLEQELNKQSIHTYLLDGDNLRYGLNSDLGFDNKSREQNLKRAAEVCKLFVDAGLVVIASFISPFEKERQMVKKIVNNGFFVDIFLDTPLEICKKRDPKGLYKKALSGEIANFTGISSPYEKPKNPCIKISSNYVGDIKTNLNLNIKTILNYLNKNDFLKLK